MRSLKVAARVRRARGRRPLRPTIALPDEFTKRVTASADDAQQIVSTEAMDITAVGADFRLESTIGDLPILGGARFTNVLIGQGGSVPYVALRFTARANNTPQVIVRIRAQAIDDAPAFTTTAGDISERTLTTAFVDWDMSEWAAGIAYDSPNLSAVLKEVTDRVGWVSGQGVVFVWAAAPTDPALSRRRAHSFDGDATHAPLLLVNTATDPDPIPPDSGAISLVGDPNFDPNAYSGDTKLWYDRIINDHVLADLGGALNWAAADNTSVMGRDLGRHAQAMLIAFRLSGDLRLLDRLDQYAELMRLDLRDEGVADGYLNWRDWSLSGGTDKQGTDLWESNDMGVHTLVASIAAALEANRAFTSPAGGTGASTRYGAHADFWKDYLVNHFEAKWRSDLSGRTGIATGFPFMENNKTATAHGWNQWPYFMGILTGDSAYTNEAARSLGVLLGSTEFREAATPNGNAWVWPRGVQALNGGAFYLHPITYAGPVFANMCEYNLAGFGPPALTSWMEKLARTHTEFLQDTADPIANGFASDIGGRVERAGIPSDPQWSRMSASNWRIRNYPLIAWWDKSDSVYNIARQLYRSDRIMPDVGCFMKLYLDANPPS